MAERIPRGYRTPSDFRPDQFISTRCRCCNKEFAVSEHDRQGLDAWSRQVCKDCFDKVEHPSTAELQRHCGHHATAFAYCRFCTKAYPYQVNVSGECQWCCNSRRIRSGKMQYSIRVVSRKNQHDLFHTIDAWVHVQCIGTVAYVCSRLPSP